jgi:competence protein ComEA
MPEIDVSRGRALVAAGALLVVLVLAGRFVLGAGAASSGGDGAAEVVAQPLRAEAAPPVVVHVVGAVRVPGLYRLGRGKRVADAVERAGGATGKADLALINLAAPVADGQQVVVPARAPPGAAAGEGGGGDAAAGPVHLNTATLQQLDELPGVGPVTTELS